MAENLNLMGLKTSLVEMQSQILAPVDFEVAAFAQNEMRQNGVELILSDGVKALFENEIELNSGKKIPYDLIILAIGVKPEIELAKNAGLNVNRGIITNDFMQTNDPDIFAGGDNVEVKSFINNENVLIPLAGPANRQGRIIADNILGKNSKYKKSQGTSVIKVFDYTIAATGLNEKQLRVIIFLIGKFSPLEIPTLHITQTPPKHYINFYLTMKVKFWVLRLSGKKALKKEWM